MNPRAAPALFATLLALGACDLLSGGPEPAGEGAARPISSPVPPGTAPQGTVAALAALAPPGPPVTPGLLERGRERYAIFCTPCHGERGRGEGVVTRYGFPSPPSLLDAAGADLPADRIVAIIGQGQGVMLPMGEQVVPEDRWAIAHYVRSLGDQVR